MKLAWTEIEPRLRQLRLVADDLKERFPDEADFMPRFADHADEVLEVASVDALGNAGSAISAMLVELGYTQRGAQSL